MRKKMWMCLALFIVIPGLLFTVSCAKKVVQSEPAAEEQPGFPGPVDTPVNDEPVSENTVELEEPESVPEKPEDNESDGR